MFSRPLSAPDDDSAGEVSADLIGAEIRTLVDNVVVVRVSGEVDSLTAPVFKGAVDKAFSHGGSRVLIDLDQVEFFGTGGFAVLVEARARALRDQVGLFLVCSNRLVLRPLELAGLLELFTVRASQEAALS